MVKACHNLAPVLRANRTTSRECNGAGGSRLTFADVIEGGQVHEMLGSTGGKPARAVRACAAGKPPVLGHANVLGGHRA